MGVDWEQIQSFPQGVPASLEPVTPAQLQALDRGCCCLQLETKTGADAEES